MRSHLQRLLGRPPRAGDLVSACLAIALVLAGTAGIGVFEPDDAVARRGYGGYRYCNAKCQARREAKACRKECNKRKKTCTYCIKQGSKADKQGCRSELSAQKAACTGEAACQSAAKQVFKACKVRVKEGRRAGVGQCKALKSDCKGCCQSQGYGSGCSDNFAGTPGFGTFFYKYRSYGRVRRFKPDCSAGARASCTVACTQTWREQRDACGGDTECFRQTDAERSGCLAGCGGQPFCGNGVTEAPEQCDSGSAGGAFVGGECGFCDQSCACSDLPAPCGNGVIDAGEECDSGSASGAFVGGECGFCDGTCACDPSRVSCLDDPGICPTTAFGSPCTAGCDPAHPYADTVGCICRLDTPLCCSTGTGCSFGFFWAIENGFAYADANGQDLVCTDPGGPGSCPAPGLEPACSVNQCVCRSS